MDIKKLKVTINYCLILLFLCHTKVSLKKLKTLKYFYLLSQLFNIRVF